MTFSNRPPEARAGHEPSRKSAAVAAPRVEPQGHVPIAILEADGESMARVKRPIAKDQPITWDDLELPDTWLLNRFQDDVVSATK